MLPRPKADGEASSSCENMCHCSCQFCGNVQQQQRQQRGATLFCCSALVQQHCGTFRAAAAFLMP